jgi:hypothetical protein
MAIAFRNAAYSSDTVYRTEPAKPTDTAENDILVALCIGQTDAGASPTITSPAGWTEIATYKIETARTWGLYWKRAGNSEPATYQYFSIPNSGTCYVSAVVAAYSGCAASGTPYDQFSNTDYQTSDLYIRGGSIDPTVDTSMAVWLGAARTNLSAATANAGWTERVDYRSSHQLYAMEKALASGAATGDVDVTFGGSAETRKHAFLLNLVETAASTSYVVRSAGAGIGSGIHTGIL